MTLYIMKLKNFRNLHLMIKDPEEQVKQFLNRAKEISHEWYPHWRLAIYTGMRNVSFMHWCGTRSVLKQGGFR